jgi:preprotein translocase subunit SecG
MATVVLVIHLLIALALIAVVLLQRSEGGALGIGGGPAGGSLFSSRGSANALTRATAMLAVAFFITSITLTIMNRSATQGPSVIDQIAPSAPAGGGAPQVPGSGGSVLPQLPGAPAPAAPAAPTQPQVPQ